MKIIRFIVKLIWMAIVAIFSIIFGTIIIIQFPSIQTMIAEKVLGGLADKLDGNIQVEKIHLKPFTTLVLKDVRIIDRDPVENPFDTLQAPIDTFFRAEYIIASFTLDGLLSNEGLQIRRAVVDNGEFNLVLEDRIDENGSPYMTDNLTRIFRIPPADPDAPLNMDQIFFIRKVTLRDFRFTMRNLQSSRPEFDYEFGMDWNDLDIMDINAEAEDLRFKEQKMYGTLNKLSFREKSGYTCRNISGTTAVGQGKTIVNNVRLQDEWSDIRVPQFMMSYANIDAFAEFLTDVRIDGTISPSKLDFTTITYFAPELKGNKLRASVSGSMSGFVDNFKVKDVKVVTEGGGFEGVVNGSMTGLPDIYNTSLNAEVKDFRLTTDGLSRFVSEWIPDGEIDLSNIAQGRTFLIDAKAEGLMNNMRVKADLKSDIGSAKADALLSDIIVTDKPIGIGGYVETDDLDLGALLGIDIIKEASIRTGVRAKLGSTPADITLDIDSLFVERLHFNEYDYSNIAGKGKVSEQAFNGTIISHDPNLNFMLQGAFALSPMTQNSKYDFYAIVGHADLNAMNFDKRGTSEIGFQTWADFTRTSSGDILGRIDIADFKAKNDQGLHDIGNISLTSHSSENESIARIASKFADISYKGSAAITEFIKDIQNITLKKELPALYDDSEYIWNGNRYDLNIKFHNSMDLLAFALPGLYIADSTSVSTHINSKGELDLKVNSSRIAFEEQYLKGLSLNLNNLDSLIGGSAICNEIMVAGLSLKNNTLEILANDNHLGVGYRYNNEEDFINNGELFAVGDISRNENDTLSLKVNILPSMLKLNSRDWTIPTSGVRISGDEIIVDKFEISSGEQRIRLDGGISKAKADTLTLNLDRFDMSIVNPLITPDLKVRGAMSGSAQLASSAETMSLLADIICDSTEVAGIPLGTLLLGSNWDNDAKLLNISMKNDYEGKSNINLRGRLNPGDKDIRAYVSLDRFNIGYAQPFLHDVFSEMEGFLSGDIMMSGPWDRFTLASRDTRIDDAILKIAYTNVPYYANGTFHIDEKGAYFDDIQVKDRYDGHGTVSGSINFDRFNDITFNTRVRANNMECVDLRKDQADVFYGNLYATGNVGITGTLNSILLSVDAVTTKTGQLHIPLSNMTTGPTSTNLLKFTQPESFRYVDPYETLITNLKAKKAEMSELGLKMRVNATPQVEAFIEIDQAGSNVISGRGSGMIDLEVNNETFNINGDYTLSGGGFQFNAANLATRQFLIQDGSSIRFNGDIMESTLDIEATYRTKTSIGTLISDTSSVSNRRNVDCGIQISDRLLNPRLNFSIEIPDLDPAVKSRVESALSTEDKIQKQFLSLIITNSFLPDDQSGIVNNNSMLYSSVTELMANQLNNILQKLDIPLDLGMKYQPNEKGRDIFDVAVSTQLFNNRVIVNGNIGNKQYSSRGQGNVVGDLDIEVKLDRSGAFRLSLFSHSNDEYTNFLDNSQRNGVGLTYQTEFSSIRQFVKNIFSNKQKRTEAKLAEEQAMIGEGRITIEIEKESDNDRK